MGSGCNELYKSFRTLCKQLFRLGNVRTATGGYNVHFDSVRLCAVQESAFFHPVIACRDELFLQKFANGQVVIISYSPILIRKNKRRLCRGKNKGGSIVIVSRLQVGSKPGN